VHDAIGAPVGIQRDRDAVTEELPRATLERGVEPSASRGELLAVLEAGTGLDMDVMDPLRGPDGREDRRR